MMSSFEVRKFGKTRKKEIESGGDKFNLCFFIKFKFKILGDILTWILSGDPFVSKSHCIITNGALKDTSKNGTRVNGSRVEQVSLLFLNFKEMF